MLSWFTNNSIENVNYEIVQYAIKNKDEYFIINTLPGSDQEYLITSTIAADKEEYILNEMLNNFHVPDRKIIVYGKNNSDDTVIAKALQLQNLGVKDIFIYVGGVFEWLLLQDVYGKSEFPTSNTILDILKFKPPKKS